MREFYTKEQVVEHLVNLLAEHHTGVISNVALASAIGNYGFTFRSFSNNSIDCKYYGKRIRVQVKFCKKKGAIPIDITYYP